MLLVTTSVCVRTVSKTNKERRGAERSWEERSMFSTIWSLRLSASSVLCKFGWPHQQNGGHCSDQHPSHLQKTSESGKQLLLDDAWDNGLTSYRKSILLLCEYVPCFSWSLQSALVRHWFGASSVDTRCIFWVENHHHDVHVLGLTITGRMDLWQLWSLCSGCRSYLI